MSEDKQTGPGAGGATKAAQRAADECGADERGAVLAAFGFDTLEDDGELTAIAAFAAELCETPIAIVNIIENDRQRFLARAGIEMREGAIEHAICAHAMRGREPMVIDDASLDARFGHNPLVAGQPGIRFYAGVPLKSPEGVPLGTLCVCDTVPRSTGLTPTQRRGLDVLARAVMRRLTARRAGRAASQRATESTRAMRQIADQLPGIIYSIDGEGRFDYFSDQWAQVTGYPPPTDTQDWYAVVHPDDAQRAFAAWTESFTKGEPFETEYRLRQFDGSWRWTLSRALPLHDGDGRVVRWFGTLTDIDSGHREFESRDLLARELSHRIKNIFAVVAGLVALRARRRPEVAGFAEELGAAIRALGRAHDFVRPVEGIKGDSLIGLLKELMAPYAGEESRVTIEGRDCAIGPRAATPLALVFHELATNAAKYGALSVEDGLVTITVDCGAGDGIAKVTWCERGGPQLEGSVSEGFGTRLLAMAVEGQLGGKYDRRYAAGGLEIDLEIPMDSISS